MGRWYADRSGPVPGPLGTTVLSFLNVGTDAHHGQGPGDIRRLDDVDAGRITDAVARSGGGVAGLKLRLVGPLALEQGEELIDRAKAAARDCGLPLMVHVGHPRPFPGFDPARAGAVTLALLGTLDRGDIVTHLCTPFAGLGELGPALRRCR